MNLKIISKADKQRTGLDHAQIRLNFMTKLNPYQLTKIYHGERNSRYFKLSDETRVYISSNKGHYFLSFLVDINGFRLMHSILNEAGHNIPVSMRALGDNNFLSIETLQSLEINWNRYWKRELSLIIFKLLETNRNKVMIELKGLGFIDLIFKKYSIDSAEITLDIISPYTSELIENDQVKRAFGSLQDKTRNFILDKDGRKRLVPFKIDDLELEPINGINYLKGETFQKTRIKCYTKQKNHKNILNRFEHVLRTKQIRALIGQNSFISSSQLQYLLESLYNQWFDILYSILGFEYEIDSKAIDKCIKDVIRRGHPNYSDLLFDALFIDGKVDINANFINKTRLSKLLKEGVLYKPDNSLKGRKYYAINPEYRAALANSLKGNRHV